KAGGDRECQDGGASQNQRRDINDRGVQERLDVVVIELSPPLLEFLSEIWSQPRLVVRKGLVESRSIVLTAGASHFRELQNSRVNLRAFEQAGSGGLPVVPVRLWVQRRNDERVTHFLHGFEMFHRLGHSTDGFLIQVLATVERLGRRLR